MNYIKILPKVVAKVYRNPSLTLELFNYCKNDFNSLIGRYKYKHRVLFIAGLPKSGTTWVSTQLVKIPGYNMRYINDPQGKTKDHDISDGVFSSLPRYGYSVVKLHTRYTKENYDIINKHVPKFIVMTRDLRDMCISRYYHVINEKEHRHHDLYTKNTLDDSLMHCIDTIGDEYVPWVRDWERVAREYPNKILLITYEELNLTPINSYKKILKFYDIPFNEDLVRQLSESKLKKVKNLKKELTKSVGLGTTSTARKGIIGDWKNHLKPAHKEKFKSITGDLLIELGYEKDSNW